jgi:hypothetical protein
MRPPSGKGRQPPAEQFFDNPEYHSGEFFSLIGRVKEGTGKIIVK